MRGRPESLAKPAGRKSSPEDLARDEHGVADADPNAHYPLTHNIFQIFSYTSDAKLIGERVYDDPASYHYDKLQPANVVAQEDARRELAPFLKRAIAIHKADTWVASTSAPSTTP